MAKIPEEVLLGMIANAGGSGETPDYPQLTNKPQINGVTLIGDKSASDLSLASLDANGKVPSSQLPSYVDDVINGYLYEGRFYEDSAHTTEITGESGKIYIDLETNKTYRWSGLVFAEISESLALGETASTAYAGNKGKANADAINAIKDGQTIDSFADVESALADKVDKVAGKVLSTNDYTDADKAIVGGVTAALAGKQDTLSAGSYIDISNNEVSVNRYVNPAGDIVYRAVTVNATTAYVDKYTPGGTFIERINITVNTYQSQDVESKIRFYREYDGWVITLLANSKEHNAGYSYSARTSGSGVESQNDFTFTISQTLDDNDLIIRSELATKQNALTFDSVPTDGSMNPVESNGVYDALATKQDKTDNNLTTTAKNVVPAINEVNSNLNALGLSVVNGKLCQTYTV